MFARITCFFAFALIIGCSNDKPIETKPTEKAPTATNTIDLLPKCSGLAYDTLYSYYLNTFKGKISRPLCTREQIETGLNNDAFVVLFLKDMTKRDRINADTLIKWGISYESWFQGSACPPCDQVNAYYQVSYKAFNDPSLAHINASLIIHATLDSSGCYVMSILIESYSSNGYLNSLDFIYKDLPTICLFPDKNEYATIARWVGSHSSKDLPTMPPVLEKRTKSLYAGAWQNTKTNGFDILLMLNP
ncbi:MAG: hypothetical protein JW913_12275 [Chitinispirillaceae bacterium]|nr:hypothetical protein [Chitinispirillaceae bacterium]